VHEARNASPISNDEERRKGLFVMQKINVALVGCGKFVMDVHLKNLISHPDFCIHATVDTNLELAERTAQASGAVYYTEDIERVLNDKHIDLVFIATPHFTHADLTKRSAAAGKHIFCEKPMALNEEDAYAVCEAVEKAEVNYMCGYNRTFAPFTVQVRDFLNSLNRPKQIYHRIADWNPYSSGWLLEENLSGGRVIGEAGHALDMMCQVVGMDPVRVFAQGGNFAKPSHTGAPDSATIILSFPDGSTGVLLLSSIASNLFPKEEVQIFCAGHTINILNFQKMDIYGPEKVFNYVLAAVDKGHNTMLDALSKSILENQSSENDVHAALRTTRAALAAVRSVKTHVSQGL